MEKDYAKYEGCIVELKGYEDYNVGGETQGVVTGCDYDIGISIQGVKDRDVYISCLNGPSSKNFKNHHITEEQYKIIFEDRIGIIERGVYNIKEGLKVRDFWDFKYIYPQAECAFT